MPKAPTEAEAREAVASALAISYIERAAGKKEASCCAFACAAAMAWARGLPFSMDFIESLEAMDKQIAETCGPKAEEFKAECMKWLYRKVAERTG